MLRSRIRAAKSPLLLFLDNLEHLSGAGAVISRLLSASEQLLILATSRVPVGRRR